MSRRRKKKNRHSAVKQSFGRSFELYFYRRIKAFPISWQWLGTVLAASVIIASLLCGYFRSTSLFGGAPDIIRYAAEKGDYRLADSLYRLSLHPLTSPILGAFTDLESIVYPEKSLLHEIDKQEKLLERYPGSRDILIRLSRLYQEIGETEKATVYWERARSLDPNNPIFSP